MGRSRFGTYCSRIREKLHGAFSESYTPRELAGSFALGAFITMLPTLGTGLLLFVVIVYVSDRVSKLALFGSILVFNPPVKWGVYVASFALGTALLGPVDGVSMTDISLDAGSGFFARLLLGNLILGVVAALVSYVVVYRLAVRYEYCDIPTVIGGTLEEITEEAIEP